MKKNWQYKKLGEVCDVVGGSTPKTTIEEYWNGDNYWVTPAELIGNKYQGPTKRKISDDAVKSANLQLLPIGTVLLSSRAPIGKVAITTVPMYCNQGFKNLICSEIILNEYVYWFLIKNNNYLNSLGNGATFKEISKRITENIIIPIPPISEQERIVGELDLLSGIIEKQKQQLKELDTLAQSIFYSMFGDPISNEKNWQIKKLGSLCKSELGKTINKNKDSGEFHPYLCAINIKWNNIDTSYLKQTRFEENELERYLVEKGDLLVCEGGDIGRSAIWDKDEKILYQNALHRLRFNGEITALYCLYVLWNFKMQDVLDSRYGKGVTIKHLVQSSLSSIPIPVPPLSLQSEFAEKIEKIEKQKEAINKSIEETQNLFDFTMDKYFG